jgi:eukaryotic-like serine/threonine-protein kinase
MLGRTVGKYRIVERLGRGGMGTVYKAVDETLDREVAIKVLNADLQDTELMKRFRAEAVTLARLNHHGIATLYELYRDDHDLLMVMEFVRGETLHDLLERVGALAPPQAAHLAVQVLDALSHAHRWGVVHRDLKPANVMVTDTGAVRVMDFGIARVLGTEHFTQGGYMMGTPAYMAPEQVLGGEVDGRADLYAVGVLLYRLLSGQLPFSADTAIAMVQKQVNEAPTPIDVYQPGLPPWCAEVLARALAKSPVERFQTADEFRQVLQASVQTASLGEMPTVATPTPVGLLRGADATRTVQTPASGPQPTRVAAPAGTPAPAAPGATAAATPPVGETTAPRPKPTTETTLVLKRKHILAIGGIAAAVLLGMVVLGVMVMRRGPTFGDAMSIGAPPVEETAADAPLTTDAAVPDLASEEAAAASGTSTAPPTAEPSSTPTTTDTAATPPVKPAPRPPAPPAAPPSSPPATAVSPASPPGTSAGTRPVAGVAVAPSRASAAPTVSFDQVRLLVKDGDKMSEVEGVLRLGDGQVALLPKSGGTPLMTVPYSGLTGAAYSRSKQPKWTGPGGQEFEEKVDLGPFGFMRSERNWVIFFTHGQPVIIRLEDNSLRTVLPAIEQRAGVKLQR